jgi:hypothetical protein
MFKKKKKQKKSTDALHKAEEVIKKDFKKAENVIKQDIKKLETPENINFFFTYGWAILTIIIILSAFVWWQFFSIHTESCDFKEGSGLLCEKFDVTNEAISIELRNLNNKSISINQVKFKSCIINPEQNIADNDRRTFNIPCNISSGKFKENIVVKYKIENFQKHSVGRISKIIP